MIPKNNLFSPEIRPELFPAVNNANPAMIRDKIDNFWRHGSHNAFICEAAAVCRQRGRVYALLWGKLRICLLRLLKEPGGLENLSRTARNELEWLAKQNFLPEWHQEQQQPNQTRPTEPGCIPLLLVDADSQIGHIYDLQIKNRHPREIPGKNELDLESPCALIQKFCQERYGRSFFLHSQDFRARIQVQGSESSRPLSGRSYELPLLLALLSRLTNRNLPDDTAASAQIDFDGRLRPVAGLTLKTAALRRERPRIRRLLVAENQPEITTAAVDNLEIIPLLTAAAAIDLIFNRVDLSTQINTQFDLEEELRQIEADFRRYRLSACHANASRLLEIDESTLKPAARFKALWFRGGCFCHFGRIDEALADFQAADNFYLKHEEHINHTDYIDMRNHYGVSLKDVFRYPEARKVFIENRNLFEQCRANSELKAKNISSLSQLESAAGHHIEAIALQREALTMFKAAQEPLSRNFGYLASICTRAGRLTEAKTALEQARIEFNREGKKSGPGREFLDCYEAELLYRRRLAGIDPEAARIGLEQLACRYQKLAQLASHAPALIWKFIGCSRLLDNDEESARPLFTGALAFFESQEIPMYLLLAASLRFERLRLRLINGVSADADNDLETGIRDLDSQPAFREYFTSHLANLPASGSKLPTNPQKREALACRLAAICEKIPY